MEFLLAIYGAAFLLFVSSVVLKWNELRYRKKGLPPGTMGWPLFGETTEFLKQGPDFVKKRRARYGILFKTHILGCPTIVSLDPELNRFILMNEGKGLVPGYPQSMLDILGRHNIAAVSGHPHRIMRGSILGLISPPNIRDQLLPDIDGFMRSHLSNWNGEIIDVQQKTKEMALLSSLKQIAGIERGSISKEFTLEFYKIVAGTISLPIDVPGTSYHKGYQGRKNILRILRQVFKERRTLAIVKSDMLEMLLNNDENLRFDLCDEQIIDLIIAILYSGYETVSTTSMMAVKYLHDHPRALEELRNEHFAIRRHKGSDKAINWDEFKSMNFTRAVIYETLRLATIVNGVLRKTTEEIDMNGYIIPKGWKIYVYLRETNYDPFHYEDPLTFNPWRWLTRNLDSQQNFMTFGGGSRLCPGKELGILEISVFLHYLVTRYRWEEVGGDKIMEFPRVEAPNGLHIRVSDH